MFLDKEPSVGFRKPLNILKHFKFIVPKVSIFV